MEMKETKFENGARVLMPDEDGTAFIFMGHVPSKSPDGGQVQGDERDLLPMFLHMTKDLLLNMCTANKPRFISEMAQILAENSGGMCETVIVRKKDGDE